MFRGIGGYAGELESICQNLQESTSAMIEVVKNITGVLNLGKICISADCEIDTDAIIKGLHAFFSAEKIPKLILVNDPELIYEKGLIETIMIKSKTKFNATKEDVTKMFEANHMPRISTIEALGNGEFNAAFKVYTEENKEYVVKIAPPRDSRVLSYENNMMKSEVFWYERMREKTDICIPEVYASDFSENIIPASYFIMEKMDGKPLWEMGFSETEYAKVQEQKIYMLTQIHRIHNHLFGYRQTGLQNSWYEAIRGMVSNLIKDCEAMGIETPNGHKLLMAIDKHENLLRCCECCMVNFDLWDSNILYHDGKLCWIDPERSFWGDRIADFITLGKGQKSLLSDKIAEIEIYNRTAEKPIVYNKNMEIRYQVAVGYLALIEEVEKYVRYEPEEENYIRNMVDAEAMFEMAFGVLFDAVY